MAGERAAVGIDFLDWRENAQRLGSTFPLTRTDASPPFTVVSFHIQYLPYHILLSAQQREGMRFCLNTEEPVLGEEPEHIHAGGDTHEEEVEEEVEVEDS